MSVASFEVLISSSIYEKKRIERAAPSNKALAASAMPYFNRAMAWRRTARSRTIEHDAGRLKTRCLLATALCNSLMTSAKMKRPLRCGAGYGTFALICFCRERRQYAIVMPYLSFDFDENNSRRSNFTQNAISPTHLGARDASLPAFLSDVYRPRPPIPRYARAAG